MPFQRLLFMPLSGIIGSGCLLSTLAAAAIVGPAGIISWVVGGVLIIFTALTYAELPAMLPRSGAIVRYPHLTHGAFTGWILGWGCWLSAVTTPPIEAEGVGAYLARDIGDEGDDPIMAMAGTLRGLPPGAPAEHDRDLYGSHAARAAAGGR
ncbi:MAG TPA: APC family permease [Streptosporangiaceae bacterium]|nr:APC family permease [Streptosporangiaceae bacterium]